MTNSQITGRLRGVSIPIHERLARWRVARHQTLRTLSAATGLSVSTLNRLELGQQSVRYEDMVVLARALGVSIVQLISEVPPRRRSAKGSVGPHYDGDG